MGEQFVMDGPQPARPVDPGSSERRPEPERDQFDRYHEELCGLYAEMQRFEFMDSVEIFERLSAWTARASEIRNRIVRSDSRRSNNFRTKQLEPFIDECERQFKYHSRIAAVNEMDAKLAGGRFT